jgi:uncharacterized membrane protein
MISVLPNIDGAARLRWLLLGSLALNLLFVGAAGAVAYRYSGPAPSTPLTNVARIEHNLAGRIDRIAESLPPSDAEIMRSEIRAEEMKVATAQADLRLSQEEVRNSLRANPFDSNAVRTAMADNRAARENFDRVLHEMIASAATRMSPAGRDTLANWPAMRDSARPLR